MLPDMARSQERLSAWNGVTGLCVSSLGFMLRFLQRIRVQIGISWAPAPGYMHCSPEPAFAVFLNSLFVMQLGD